MNQHLSRDLKEPSQTSSRVLLIRPGSFGRNEAAAGTNTFMESTSGESGEIANQARREFDGLAQCLADAGVQVIIDEEPNLPDSVFPNNWFSYHQPAGRSPVMITYPMTTPLRRLERRAAVIDRIREAAGKDLEHIHLEHFEAHGEALEGTGSLVLDRVQGVAFACRSPRTTDAVLDAWGEATGFEIERFDAFGEDGTPVYHTNVIMSVGSAFAVFAADCVPDTGVRSRIMDRLGELGKEVLDISPAQVGGMCANVLELQSVQETTLLAMSARAHRSFTNLQCKRLEDLAQLVVADIPTIERIGGGSVRCMIAELGVQSS